MMPVADESREKSDERIDLQGDDRVPRSLAKIFLNRAGESTFFLLTALLLWNSFWRAEQVLRPFNTSAFDGTFQLLNSLRRLTAGSVLGSDYVVFHGPLWESLQLPVYLLSTNKLFAIEASKYSLNMVLPSLVAGALTVAFLKRNPWRWWFGSFSMAVVAFLSNVEWLAIASSLGQRASIGMFFIVVSWIALRGSGRRSLVVIVVILGFTLTASFDQGIYASVAVIIGVTCWLLLTVVGHRGARAESELRRPQLARALFLVSAPWVVWIVLVAAACHFRFDAIQKTLRFYFSDLPGDQRWFFGTWPAFSIESWSDLGKFHTQLLFYLAAGIGLCAISLVAMSFRRDPSNMIGPAVSLSLSCYSVLASWTYIGSYSGAFYFQPGTFALALALILLCADAVSHRTVTNARASYSNQRSSRFLLYLWVVMVIPTLIAIPLIVSKSDSNFMSEEWVNYESVMRDTGVKCGAGEMDLWSTYPSLIQYQDKCFSPVGDLLIHAIGSRRAVYNEAFKETPAYWVETARNDVLPWEAWLRSTNWSLYEEIYTHYLPVSFTPHSILWQRTATPNSWLTVPYLSEDITISQDGRGSISKPPVANLLGVVTVDYVARQPFSWIPIVGKQSLFQVLLTGSKPAGEQVSLNPQDTRQRFPVNWNGSSQTIDLEFKKKGLGMFDSLVVQRVHIDWYEQPNDPNAGWPMVFGDTW